MNAVINSALQYINETDLTESKSWTILKFHLARTMQKTNGLTVQDR